MRARYTSGGRNDGPWTGAATARVKDNPPAAPTGLTASEVTHNSVTLTWTPPDSGSAVAGYRVLRGTNANSLSTIAQDTSNTGTEYTDTTMTAETTYHYAVLALSQDGDGAQSTTTSATTPAAPQEQESKDPPKGTPVPNRVTRAAPGLREAIVGNNGAEIRIRFTENVDRTNVPPASAFTVTADGIALTVSSITSSSTIAERFFITVTPLIQANQVVVITYTDPTSGDDANAIQDDDGNDAPSFTTGRNGVPAVTNISNIADTKGPALAAAAADSTSLVITFYENLAAAASLANSAFTVKKTPSGATEATIVTLSATVGPVISGKTVTLTLATELAATDSVTVTYTKPTTGTANKLVDAATNETGTFTDQTVINNTVDLTVTSIVRQSPTSSPTKVDTLTWRVTFNEEAQNVDAADFSVTGTTATLAVSAVSGVTGAYDVTASGGNLASLNTTVTLSIAASHNIQDTSSNALTNTTPTGTNDKTYVVDNTPPTLIGAAVFPTGVLVELRFSEDMDQTNLPPASAATVTADDIALTVSEIVGVPGDLPYQLNLIWLYHLPVIRMGQVVVVTYTDPTDSDDANAIQDLAGNDVPSFTTEIPNSANTTLPVAPDAPTDLSATANGATAITLAWTAPADNGGRIISGYKVEVSTDSGTTWTVQVPTTGSTATTYGHTGLTTGTTRHYRVSAITLEGTSSASNTANATTATLTPSPATGVPAITVPNALRVKAVLTANKGTIADTNGLPEESAFTWQWVRVDGSTDTDIAGATNQTYALTYADVGKTIKVKASFTDNAGDSEGPLTSAATSTILAQGACYAPTYRGGATQIWTGKVGVEPSPAGDLGYSGPLSETQHGSLDTPSFTVTTGGSSFTVVTIRTDTVGRLIFGVNAKYGVAERQLSLYVCDQQILFSEATKLIHPTYDLRSWSPRYGDFNWSNQAERTLYISRDQTPPTFAEVNFSGTAITVTFTEDLNAASLADGAFTVKKTPTSGTEETVTLSGTPTINGKTVTLTLGAAPAATDKVTLTYTKPASGTGNKLADKFGNEAANFTDVLLRSRHEPSGQDFRHSAGTPGFVTTGTASRGQLTYPADGDPWADYGDPSWGDMFRLVGLEPRKTYRVEVDFTRAANTVGGSIQMYICCNHGPDPYAVSEWDSNYDGRAIFDFDTGRTVGATFVSVIPSNSMNPDVWEFGDYTVKLTDVTGLRKLVSNTSQRPVTVTYAKIGKNTDLHATDRTQLATSFVTGSNPDGYTLDRITAYISLTDGTDTGTGTPKVTILNNATSDRPGTNFCDLQSLADYETGLNLSNGDWPDELYSTGCASNTLAAGTTYWVVFSEDSSEAQTYFVGEANSEVQDPGSASGWSIGDHYYRKTGIRAWIPTNLSPLAIGVYGTPKKVIGRRPRTSTVLRSQWTGSAGRERTT